VEEICAKISNIIFSNNNTSYYILKAIPEGNGNGDAHISVKGNFPNINISSGLKAKFRGHYAEHPRFGKQFNAIACEIVPESGKDGVISYLIANVRSIGPLTAEKLYKSFGDDLLNILEKNPDKIRDLKYLNKKQAEALIEEWSKASENRTLAIFLADLGLNSRQIRSVYDLFGFESKAKISENPYCLTRCAYIGFPTADKVARKLGVGIDDIRRVRAVILYALEQLSTSDGHMYAMSNQIHDMIDLMYRRNELEPFSHGAYLSDSGYYAALMDLQKSNDIQIVDDCIYLYHKWEQERATAEYLFEFIKQKPRALGDLEAIFKEFEDNEKIRLSDEQKSAFFKLKDSRICVISGYPGTGKTLLTKAFVYLFEKNKFDYVLMSPTGIAAKRTSQLSNRPAFTIHRALGYGKDGSWQFDQYNKFIADAVIVDEASMLGSATFYHFIRALHPSTILIIMGDVAQLPSVEAGCVLYNLMNSDIVSHTKLTKIYRQEATSDIVEIAHKILNNDHINTSFNSKSEVVFLEHPDEKVINEVCKFASLLKSKNANFQVIAPKYDGSLGINNLNQELRKVLNPEVDTETVRKLKLGDSSIYEGDRVMIVKNDYDRSVFNGDVGKVVKISSKDDIVEVKIFDWFDQDSKIPKYVDKVISFSQEEARQVLRVAYASSLHKCQGMEFDYVILPMTYQYGIMLYRRLIYTGLTRARKKVFIFGNSKAFLKAVNNDKDDMRNSNLAKLISDVYKAKTNNYKIPAPSSRP
jgi:exodeoxyribonuclease V alpha subunit